VRAILTGRSDDTLLPLVTSRPTLEAASAVLRGYLAGHFPDLAADRVHEVVDNVVRLVLSHAVVPVDPPAVVGGRVARLVEAALGSA
jgi:hypothetical protein